MSYPEKKPKREERTLTIIVVPHDGLETGTFVFRYARVKLAAIVAGLLLALLGVLLAFLIPIMATAARVPGLLAELQQLDSERARVAELARTLQEVEAQYERVRQLLGADAPPREGAEPLLPPLRTDTGPAAAHDADPLTTVIDLWPLATPGFITRALSDGRSRHPGLDIAVPRNSYIRAAGPGTVRAAGVDDVYGQFVVLEHGEGLETVYGHASRLFVTAGDRVRRGQVIGLTGSTGRSTAPHLHFEVRRDGRPVDPLAFVRQP